MSDYDHPATQGQPNDSVSYRGAVALEQQIAFVRSCVEGRRSGREHCWNEFVRLDGEVRMWEAMLKSLEEQAAFGGDIYLARCVYTYGWRQYSVYAKDAEHAGLLMDKWLKSEDGRSETAELHEDAGSDYQSAMEDYRDEKRVGALDDELRRPRKPKKNEFRLTLQAVYED